MSHHASRTFLIQTKTFQYVRSPNSSIVVPQVVSFFFSGARGEVQGETQTPHSGKHLHGKNGSLNVELFFIAKKKNE